jgi:RNase P/RNase MRP subunit POP5
MTDKAGVTSLKYNPEKQRGILRMDRRFVDHLRSCFAMIKNLNNQAVLVRTLRVSGMIGKVKGEIY